MDKRQQWIIGAIAVLAAVAIGSVVYRQYALVTPGSTFRNGALGSVSQGNAGTSDAVVEETIPDGDISPDDVAKGIGDDLLKEESGTESEAAAEKESATAGATVLNEYENAYEENNI
ncbi:MAG: hypothetical protein HGB34_04090 [Candidatus Moranbacteria bacterium]|nr:hypothetical protein [Candidatus Moranbacteria bacterium]